jgi:hypothetical protein
MKIMFQKLRKCKLCQQGKNALRRLEFIGGKDELSMISCNLEL